MEDLRSKTFPTIGIERWSSTSMAMSPCQSAEDVDVPSPRTDTAEARSAASSSTLRCTYRDRDLTRGFPLAPFGWSGTRRPFP